VLTIRDDKLNVRHDDDASSEVAEGGFSHTLRKLSGEQSNPARQLWVPGILGMGTVGTKTCHNNIFVFIFEFYSLIQI
jgi:hypothetical protein